MRCPNCETPNSIVISLAFTARQIGRFSLAGVQMKVSARQVAFADCSACGLHVVGYLDNPELAADGRTFTGGHFVVESPPPSR